MQPILISLILGAGGGWLESNATLWREVTGGSVFQGAIGGKPCGQAVYDAHGAGGFGGGGGGCITGGGGGGYAGKIKLFNHPLTSFQPGTF